VEINDNLVKASDCFTTDIWYCVLLRTLKSYAIGRGKSEKREHKDGMARLWLVCKTWTSILQKRAFWTDLLSISWDMPPNKEYSQKILCSYFIERSSLIFNYETPRNTVALENHETKYGECTRGHYEYLDSDEERSTSEIFIEHPTYSSQYRVHSSVNLAVVLMKISYREIVFNDMKDTALITPDKIKFTFTILRDEKFQKVKPNKYSLKFYLEDGPTISGWSQACPVIKRIRSLLGVENDDLSMSQYLALLTQHKNLNVFKINNDEITYDGNVEQRTETNW
jgi:hypothetical protein